MIKTMNLKVLHTFFDKRKVRWHQQTNPPNHQITLTDDFSLEKNQIRTTIIVDIPLLKAESIICDGCGDLTIKGLIIKRGKIQYCIDCAIQSVICDTERYVNE